MSRAPARIREQARRLFIGGNLNNAQIAANLQLKPHTVGRWRKQQDWDGEKIALEKDVAEKLRAQTTSERIELNRKHYKFWEALMGRVAEALTKSDFTEVRILTRLAAIIDRAQKGQRLARGLNLTGQTEEIIRAEAQSDNRTLVNLLLDIIKEHVTDETTRDRIADAITEAVSQEEVLGPEDRPHALRS